MRIETTRVATPARLAHTVGFHSSPENLLGQVQAVVAAAIERGAPVALAVRPATEAALRESIGSAAGVVALSRPTGHDGLSGQTVAARWARELRALVGEAGSASVVVEHDTAFDGVDGGFWTELDAAVNVALSELPIAVTCFFPEEPLHLQIVGGALVNHSHLLVGGEVRDNPEHRGPREVLGAVPAPAPPLLGPPDRQLTYGAWELHDVRAAVEDVARSAGFGLDRAEDVVLAINEVATNAVEHGALEAQLLLWSTGGELVCEVHDTGTLADPLPGLRAPHPSDPRGRGVWIARQLCDVLHVWSDRLGTRVRVRALP